MSIADVLLENFPAQTLFEICQEVGTPCYVYAGDRVISNYTRLKQILTPMPSWRLCYSVKANSNLFILKLLAEQGAWFEVVSLGELKRLLAVGVAPDKIVFTGMGKREDELTFAIEGGIGWIVVENPEEIVWISEIASAVGKVQAVALRINPCIDTDTHKYLDTGAGDSKFGMAYEEALQLVASWKELRGVAIRGVHVHVGSMLAEVRPYELALKLGLRFIAEARALGCPISMLDLGGGFAVAYQEGDPEPPLEEIAKLLLSHKETAELEIFFEPGRAVVADAGILLTRVLYNKFNAGTHYVVLDAGMNDLIRPALYGAIHRAWVVSLDSNDRERLPVSLVGPICESADILVPRVSLPPVQRGDLIAISHAGAYGMSMASQYNSRPRGAEVLIRGAHWQVIRPRETIESLWAEELNLLQHDTQTQKV